MLKETFLVCVTCVLISCSGSVPAQPAPLPENDEACEVLGEDQPCSPLAYRVLELSLEDLYRRHLVRLRDSLDEVRLRESQRVWTRFVDADCLFEVGVAEAPEDFSTKGRRCRAIHLRERIQQLKRLYYCQSSDCDEELATEPLPTVVTTLVLGGRSVVAVGAGVLRRRPTGAYVPTTSGEAVEPGDQLLVPSGGGFQVNGKTFGGNPYPYLLRVQ